MIFSGDTRLLTYEGKEVPVHITRSMDQASMPGRSRLTGEPLPGYEGQSGSEPPQSGQVTVNGTPLHPFDEPVLMEYNPQKWLEERLAFWQRQLRLQDWDLTVERSSQLETGGKSATTWMSPGSKEGRIRIWRREEWMGESQRYGTWDEELFLVHELVHLHLWAWKGADDEGDQHHEDKEAAIDLMAQALVRMSRGEFR